MKNTKLIMTTSAVVLGLAGILLTFIPDLLLEHLYIEPDQITVLFIQIIGALYFAFAMLNWMSKASLIGGIYNRPLAVANFTHFLIAGLAIMKLLISNPGLPCIIWVGGLVYLILGVSFGIILFRSPVVASD